jgi:hypothetical protein
MTESGPTSVVFVDRPRGNPSNVEDAVNHLYDTGLADVFGEFVTPSRAARQLDQLSVQPAAHDFGGGPPSATAGGGPKPLRQHRGERHRSRRGAAVSRCPAAARLHSMRPQVSVRAARAGFALETAST